MSAQSPPDYCGKENTAANVVTAKKRKSEVKSVKLKRKHLKVVEDNSMMVDTHAGQENGAPGENGAAETAPTHSGRKSNLPSRFKDAGYASLKRNMQKNKA
jgi:hypothetical protein